MKKILFIISLVLTLFLGGCGFTNTEQIDDLQAELDAIEEYDDTALLEEIAALEAELALHEETIAKLTRIDPIFLNLPEDQIIQYGDDFDLLSLGLTADDNLDGDLTSSITVNFIDTTQLVVGEHTVIYSVIDSNDNLITDSITITVQYTDLYYDYVLLHDNTEVSIIGYSDDGPKDAVIPAILGGLPVTAVGGFAFFGMGLTSVVIPDSVTSIGYESFHFNLLTNVTIGNNVTTIGDYAFFSNELTDLTIGNNVTIIGKYAFFNNKLTNLIIGNSVTTIGEYAFNGNRLTSIVIPEGVTIIGNYAFFNNSLTSVTILGVETRFNENWDIIGFYDVSAP